MPSKKPPDISEKFLSALVHKMNCPGGSSIETEDLDPKHEVDRYILEFTGHLEKVEDAEQN
jgi:hypothetical protein